MTTTSIPETDPTSTRPGGRSARVRADVHRAVEELLGEVSPDALTIPMIAARAGVHPTTVYRRWGSIRELLGDVATSRFSGGLVVPDSGTLRADLVRWVSDVVTDVADPDILALLRATLGVAGADGAAACSVDRRVQLAAMLDRERARGGTAPTVDQAADSLLGPIYYRALFTGQPGDARWRAALVDSLLG